MSGRAAQKLPARRKRRGARSRRARCSMGFSESAGSHGSSPSRCLSSSWTSSLSLRRSLGDARLLLPASPHSLNHALNHPLGRLLRHDCCAVVVRGFVELEACHKMAAVLRGGDAAWLGLGLGSGLGSGSGLGLALGLGSGLGLGLGLWLAHPNPNLNRNPNPNPDPNQVTRPGVVGDSMATPPRTWTRPQP